MHFKNSLSAQLEASSEGYAFLLIYHIHNRAVGSSPGVGRLIDQSGDAAKGSEIEACSADHSARKKIFRLHFQLSGWALVALSYFED